MSRRRGFTLVELLVVIAIIGILAAIHGQIIVGAIIGHDDQHVRLIRSARNGDGEQTGQCQESAKHDFGWWGL